MTEISGTLDRALAEADWQRQRCGFATASHAYDICHRGARGQRTAAWDTYLAQVVTERITGEPTWTPTTAAMQWGIDHEDDAAQAYEALTGRMVTGTGKDFFKSPDIPWLGASPDRLVGDDGLVEIKCPNSTTHIERLRTREIPEQYRWQMNIQLLVTGRRWCDFCDFDPRLGGKYAPLRILVIRHEPGREEMDATRERVAGFLDAVQEQVDALAALAAQASND